MSFQFTKFISGFPEKPGQFIRRGPLYYQIYIYHPIYQGPPSSDEVSPSRSWGGPSSHYPELNISSGYCPQPFFDP